MNGLIGLFITTTFGILITFLFRLDVGRIERIGLGILLGFGFQTFFMFIFYLFGLKFTLLNSLAEVLGLALGLSIAIFLTKSFQQIIKFLKIGNSISFFKKLSSSFIKADLLTKLFVAAIFGLLLTSLLVGVFFPVYGWDSLVLYDFRAITFVATGGMADGISRGYFFGYPLMTSLAHTWMYFFKGNPHLFYWGLYFGFTPIVYYCLRPFLSRLTLMLTTLILISLMSIYTGSYFDYTNFPYLIYLISSILYLCRYTKEKNKAFLLIGSILVGLSTWVRQTEPFWVVNMLFVVALLVPEMKKRFFSTLLIVAISFGIFFAIQQPWRLYETSMIGGGRNISDQAGYAIHSIQVFNLPRLIDVVATTIQGTIPTWQPYLLIAFFVGMFARKDIKKARIFLYFVLANIALLFFGTYIFSYIWPENWKAIIDSQQRLSSFIVPLLIIFTATVSDDYIVQGKKAFQALFKFGITKILD
ncbi:MAG TPA: hypothetical protein VKC53_01500 [Patescibacteria group bacterium]|nr:hypothetical protein [Patescibacteria group bacterium]